MKKFFLAILFCVALVQANQLKASCCDDFDFDFDLDYAYAEAKYAAFFPLNSEVREIYKKVLPDFELEFGAKFCNNWQAWFDVGYVFTNGASDGCGNKTHLSLIPLSLGASYRFNLCDCLDFYIGAGPSYSFLRIKDHSEFVHENVSKNAWGAVVRSGVYYYYSECIYFEGFFDYNYVRFDFHNDHDSDTDDLFVERRNADLSCLKLGVAVGVTF